MDQLGTGAWEVSVSRPVILLDNGRAIDEIDLVVRHDIVDIEGISLEV